LTFSGFSSYFNSTHRNREMKSTLSLLVVFAGCFGLVYSCGRISIKGGRGSKGSSASCEDDCPCESIPLLEEHAEFVLVDGEPVEGESSEGSSESSEGSSESSEGSSEGSSEEDEENGDVTTTPSNEGTTTVFVDIDIRKKRSKSKKSKGKKSCKGKGHGHGCQGKGYYFEHDTISEIDIAGLLAVFGLEDGSVACKVSGEGGDGEWELVFEVASPPTIELTCSNGEWNGLVSIEGADPADLQAVREVSCEYVEAASTEATTEAATTEATTEAATTEATTEAAPTEAATEAAPTEAATEAASTEDNEYYQYFD
jgi:hypothetical protein